MRRLSDSAREMAFPPPGTISDNDEDDGDDEDNDLGEQNGDDKGVSDVQERRDEAAEELARALVNGG